MANWAGMLVAMVTHHDPFIPTFLTKTTKDLIKISDSNLINVVRNKAHHSDHKFADKYFISFFLSNRVINVYSSKLTCSCFKPCSLPMTFVTHEK